MAETSYLLPLFADARIRHFHRTVRQRVVAFSLQLEVRVRSEWHPVIRYDTAHGRAHIDRYTLSGKSRKEWLRLDFREALTRAERDLRVNWVRYHERFLRGEWP